MPSGVARCLDHDRAPKRKKPAVYTDDLEAIFGTISIDPGLYR